MKEKMNVSKAYFKHLEEIEGRDSNVYPDSGGEPTIGIGHLLTNSERKSGKIIIGSAPVRYAGGLTDNQIEALAKQDSWVAVKAINDLVNVPLTQNQFDALVSFVFNIGTGKAGFAGSTLLKKLNLGLYEEIPAQMRRWVRDNGRIVEGLINRREKEIALWLKK